MKRPKRVRKPKDLVSCGTVTCTFCGKESRVDFTTENWDNPKQFKRLQSWLTKAIKYIEQEGK